MRRRQDEETARIAGIVSDLRASSKYGSVCEDTLSRIAAWAASRYPPKESLKAAKRKLHQVHGAFRAGVGYGRLEEMVQALADTGDGAAIRDACARILRLHSSTRERLPFIEELYRRVFEMTGRPESVLDLAGGYSAFGLPYMGLSPRAEYIAWDIDCELARIAGLFMRKLGYRGKSVCADVLGSREELIAASRKADVVFLLKALPSLDRQERDAGRRVLECIECAHVVVSFPSRTLSGKKKGMRGAYDEGFRAHAPRAGSIMESLAYPNETFYILEKPFRRGSQ